MCIPTIYIVGKGMFDPKNRERFDWDSAIPFKHVNNGKDRAVEWELKAMIDYLLKRLSDVSIIPMIQAFTPNTVLHIVAMVFRILILNSL